MNPNVKIEWLTKSPDMKLYFDGARDVQFTGGTYYEIEAINALRQEYSITLNSAYVKKENARRYFLKSHTKYINAEVCVLDPYVLAFGKFDRKKTNIAIIHHIDESLGSNSLLGKLFLKRLLNNLKKMDAVVTVSQFWKNYLSNKGVKNIHVIYNSFDLKNFSFYDDDINTFKNKLEISTDKPLVYLGKYSAGKGVDRVLENIDTSKYNLVASGKSIIDSNDLKIVYFSSNEFPMFLSVCDVVLSMSTMPEGWNRIAHEALLVKTPVIGSGTGGMRELLTEGGQKVVTDLSHLEAEIDDSIENQVQLGQTGYNYVKQFNLEYFKNAWLDLLQNTKRNH